MKIWKKRDLLFANFENKGFATKRKLSHVKNIFFGKIFAETKNFGKVAPQLYFPLGVLNYPLLIFLLCQKSSFSSFRQNMSTNSYRLSQKLFAKT
jgi:hypothetical protein